MFQRFLCVVKLQFLFGKFGLGQTKPIKREADSSLCQTGGWSPPLLGIREKSLGWGGKRKEGGKEKERAGKEKESSDGFPGFSRTQNNMRMCSPLYVEQR